MAGIGIPRRSLNSVSQDLAPLMTIEDDDDEGVIRARPSTSTLSSHQADASPASRAALISHDPISPVTFSPATPSDYPDRYHAQNSSSLGDSDATVVKKETPRANPCLKWTFGFFLIVAGVVLNCSTPIYTVSPVLVEARLSDHLLQCAHFLQNARNENFVFLSLSIPVNHVGEERHFRHESLHHLLVGADFPSHLDLAMFVFLQESPRGRRSSQKALFPT